MKKKLLISIMALASVFSLAGCAKKQNRTVEYLFDRYVEAYSKANVEAAKDIYPPYYVESAKQYLSKEYLDSNLKTQKERFGDDFSIEYEITKKTKMSTKELKKLNDDITKLFKIKYKAKECYKIEGTTTFKGEKLVEGKAIKNINYCNYRGAWYLVAN